jgi:hypothetical protein
LKRLNQLPFKRPNLDEQVLNNLEIQQQCGDIVMSNNYFKQLRVRLHSTGSGVMLSAFLTLLGLTPQPVAARL